MYSKGKFSTTITVFPCILSTYMCLIRIKFYPPVRGFINWRSLFFLRSSTKKRCFFTLEQMPTYLSNNHCSLFRSLKNYRYLYHQEEKCRWWNKIAQYKQSLKREIFVRQHNDRRIEYTHIHTTQIRGSRKIPIDRLGFSLSRLSSSVSGRLTGDFIIFGF